MITRKDVAERAGVSVAVVSYVLNNSNYVSEEKKKRVLEAVKELNYHPNYMARSLKTNKTYNIALVCDDIRGELFAEIAYYMEQYAYASGYNVFLCNSHKDDMFIQRLINHRTDGIFVATSIYDTKQLNHLASGGTPVVLYKTKDYEELSDHIKCICVDYYNGIRVLVRHLYEKGYRKMAYLPPYLSTIRNLESRDYRLRGFCDEMGACGLSVTETQICLQNESYDSIVKYALDFYDKNKKEKPVAFVAANDYTANMIVNMFREKGIYLMEDFAIVGMDNTASAHDSFPKLTTVGFSKEKMAECVVQTLVSEKDFDKTDVHFPVSLIEGGSC